MKWPWARSAAVAYSVEMFATPQNKLVISVSGGGDEIRRVLRAYERHDLLAIIDEGKEQLARRAAHL